MKSNKLKIKKIEIESFETAFADNEADALKGGRYTCYQTCGCVISVVVCPAPKPPKPPNQ